MDGNDASAIVSHLEFGFGAGGHVLKTGFECLAFVVGIGMDLGQVRKIGAGTLPAS